MFAKLIVAKIFALLAALFVAAFTHAIHGHGTVTPPPATYAVTLTCGAGHSLVVQSNAVTPRAGETLVVFIGANNGDVEPIAPLLTSHTWTIPIPAGFPTPTPAAVALTHLASSSTLVTDQEIHVKC